MEKFKNSMLKDPAVREQLKAEVCGIPWTMKIFSMNLEKHFCFLCHEDFPDNVFCPEFRITGETPRVGSDCQVTIEIAERNGEYSFKAKTCRVLSSGSAGKASDAKSAKQYTRPNDFRKNGAGNRPFSPGSGNAGSSGSEDFYHSREEFFKASRMGSDEGVFAIYLNRALTNFCLQTDGAIPPQNEFKSGSFRKKIEEMSPAVQQKLASFLFLFVPEVEPAGYSDKEDTKKPWNTICADYGELLVSLRNFFSHTDRELQNELRLKDSFYRFLGRLNGEIASSVKKDTHALANFPLFRRIVKKEGKKFVSYQELTKHGITFVCCMALFKDEADRFCAQLAGLKKNDMFSDSMREYFTKTSFPPHRQLLEQKTPEVLMFADMINYLNKVPSVCFQNLSLQSERNRMDELKNLSHESEDNKSSRFRLHERSGDKFASYALSYLTDFNILPHFTFRHLDTSSDIGRQRYSYEQFPDDTLPLDRRFIIDHDSAQFEWKLPEEQPHSGRIHIKALRGMLTDRTLQEILYLALDPAGMKLSISVDQKLHQWLSTYHAFLEKVLDRGAVRLPLSIGDFLPELQILSGKTADEISRNFSESVGPVIGQSLVTFFENQSPAGEKDRTAELIAKVEASLEHDLELEKRFHKEKLSDALMIRQVFRFFNLHLENTCWQFRQLPLSEQHRGCLDYEYQTVHAMIGKYTSSPKELWKHFRKMSEKTKSKDGAAFCQAAGLSPKDACSYCSSRANLLEQSKVLKRAASLEELAFAALRECIRESRNVLRKLTSPDVEKPTSEELTRWTARYGLKQEKRYDSDDLFRTVLKINRSDWQNAFDYKTGSSWKNRPLESSGFIVPQINLPQDFFQNMLASPEILARLEKNPRSPWNPETGKIDFLRAIRLIEPAIRLRGYYDDSTLVQWLKDNSGKQTTMPVCPERKNNVIRAYKNIRKVFARDKLLILAAIQYWNKYCRHETRLKFIGEDDRQPADVYDFFSRDIVYAAAGQKFRIHLNDLNKLSFSQLIGSREIIRTVCEILSLPPDAIPDFDTLNREMSRIKDSDTRIRRKFIIPVLKFYDNAGNVPVFQRPAEMSEREWDDVLPRKIAEALHNKGYGTQLSIEDIVLLMDFRNALMHDKFNLERKYSPAERIEPLLQKMGYMPGHKQ